MKKGLILINAYTQSQSELNQPRRLKEELEKLGVSATIERNALFTDEKEYDFCVYFDKDKYCARRLERAGMRLFNRAAAIETCDDKALTCLALEGFPMPKTMFAPLCYYPAEPFPQGFLEKIEREIGYPVVVKECFGSLGKGVFKAEDRAALVALCEKLKQKPHLFQQCIRESEGRDVRVIVIGEHALCAMKRTSNGFLSNVAAGGSGEPYELDCKTKTLCEEVAKRLNLDYCGIDLLFSEEGFVVCEVNSNAFFGATERVTGVNVAKAYAEHILSVIGA